MKYKIILVLVIQLLITLNMNAQIKFLKSYIPTYSGGMLGNNEVSAIQSFDGNYYVGSNSSINNGDIYLMKLNIFGDTLWTKTYGGNFDDLLFSMEQTADSGLILAGSTRSFSMGQSDAFVIKTNANGNIIWSKNYGGFESDGFSSIYQTSDNGFIALGTSGSFNFGVTNPYLVKLSANGAIQWTKTLGGTWVDEGYSVRPTFDNGYIITGSTKSFTASSGRIYLIKTDSLGNPEWSKIFGGIMGEGGHCVRQCADSGFVVTGYTNSFGNGSSDVYLLKTTLNGNLQWMKTYGGSDSDVGFQVELTNDGGFIVTAKSYSFPPGGGSYLIKTNANGNLLWTKNYVGPVSNGYCVLQTNDNGFLFVTNQPNLSVYKTDSLGNVGCNDYGTNTIVTTVSPIITSGVNVGSGGTAGSITIPLRYTSCSLTTICFTTNNNEINFDSRVYVFPNPVQDKLTIAFPQNINDPATFTIKNLAGQTLFFRKEQSRDQNIFTIDLRSLAGGIYFLETQVGENQFVKKIVKE